MLIILQCVHTLSIQVSPVFPLGPDRVIQNCMLDTSKINSFTRDEVIFMKLLVTCSNYLMETLISLAWYNRPQDH